MKTQTRKFTGPHNEEIQYALQDTGELPRRIIVITKDMQGRGVIVGDITARVDHWQVFGRGNFGTQYSAAEYLLIWAAFSALTSCPWCSHPWRVDDIQWEQNGSGIATLVCDKCHATEERRSYPPDPPRPAKCDNCETVWEDGLDEIQDYDQRVDEGGEEPAGQCQECGALCYWYSEDIEADQAEIEYKESHGVRPRSE